jgi:hypothetical protein
MSFLAPCLQAGIFACGNCFGSRLCLALGIAASSPTFTPANTWAFSPRGIAFPSPHPTDAPTLVSRGWVLGFVGRRLLTQAATAPYHPSYLRHSCHSFPNPLQSRLRYRAGLLRMHHERPRTFCCHRFPLLRQLLLHRPSLVPVRPLEQNINQEIHAKDANHHKHIQRHLPSPGANAPSSDLLQIRIPNAVKS